MISRSFVVMNEDRSSPPVVLTIAGSDSGGGAGVQADLKTFHRFGVYGASAITAVTAQNTLGVHSIHAVPIAEVLAQIDAVATDLRPAALKTGMLATAELTRSVAARIVEHGLERLVVDPVMVATSGDRLLEPQAEAAILHDLVPICTVLTPNLHEAEILADRRIDDLEGMRSAARALVAAGAEAVLLKGGHLEGDALDLLWDGSEEHTWRRPRMHTRHTHGTGCTLSAAIAAGLARGWPTREAVDRAVRFVARAIGSAPGLGGGSGPIDHFASTD
jgi:hydroxymethylpyrimidine/phosphomethylpyrimidine kinase